MQDKHTKENQPIVAVDTGLDFHPNRQDFEQEQERRNNADKGTVLSDNESS